MFSDKELLVICDVLKRTVEFTGTEEDLSDLMDEQDRVYEMMRERLTPSLLSSESM